jgi:hypothetical protein
MGDYVNEFMDFFHNKVNPMEIAVSSSFFEEAAKTLAKTPLTLLTTVQVAYDNTVVTEQVPPQPNTCRLVVPSDLASIKKAEGTLEMLERFMVANRQAFDKYLERRSDVADSRHGIGAVVRPFEHACVRMAYAKPLTAPGEDWPFTKGINGRVTQEKLEKLQSQWLQWVETYHNQSFGGLATSMGLKIFDVVDKDEDQANKHKCEQKQQRKNVITSASVK